MLSKAFLVGIVLIFTPVNAVHAETCPGNPNALGISRVMKVSAKEGPVGLVSYKKTLDLQDREVILTFDDGPIPYKTPAVLATLAKECTKATFFTVGTMVSAYPKLVQEEAAQGHTIGTHTWSHRYLTQRRNRNVAQYQISGGLHAADVALGDKKEALSPFFRFPGLNHNKRLDAFVARNGLISVSVDVVADDWLFISANEVLKRTLARLEQRGRGIILMHDIHNRTVQMLPELLKELKTRGYKVVHIVPEREETQVALASLRAPDNRAFQTAMVNTRTKIAKFAPLEQAPVYAAVLPSLIATPASNNITATVKPDIQKVVDTRIVPIIAMQNTRFAQGIRSPVVGAFGKLEMRGMN